MSLLDPVQTSQFEVFIQGLNREQTFQARAVLGLGLSTECLDRPESTAQTISSRKGKTRCDNIVIQRTFTGDDTLYHWFKECQQGAVTKRSGSIVIKNDSKKIASRFDFFQAWPIRWSAPDFLANDDSSIGFETLVLAAEDLTFDGSGAKTPAAPSLR